MDDIHRDSKTEESKKRLQESSCVKFLMAMQGFTGSIKLTIYGMEGRFKVRKPTKKKHTCYF